MKQNCFNSFSAQTTKLLAVALAKEALKTKSGKYALVLALKGELGAGKTTFIQGFIKALGIRNRVTSPTFVIVKSFKFKASSFKRIYHIDAYRLKKPKELLALGFREIIADPQNIVLIEWADKIRKILPKNVIWITFRHGKKSNERNITFN